MTESYSKLLDAWKKERQSEELQTREDFGNCQRLLQVVGGAERTGLLLDLARSKRGDQHDLLLGVAPP